MSCWTYVDGVIEVRPAGRSQLEIKYVLDTVLEHLPRVTGSENDMSVFTLQESGYSESSSHDEFHVPYKYRRDGFWADVQRNYIIVVNGSLRDRVVEETYKEFQKWLCRLAKRVGVESVFVRIRGNSLKTKSFYKECVLNYSEYDDNPYERMFESPSWSSDNDEDEYPEPAWWEFLMWDRSQGGYLPVMLEYKYFNNEVNDEEAERRIRYQRGD